MDACQFNIVFARIYTCIRHIWAISDGKYPFNGKDLQSPLNITRATLAGEAPAIIREHLLHLVGKSMLVHMEAGR